MPVDQPRIPVLVVGAGPAGLTAALALAFLLRPDGHLGVVADHDIARHLEDHLRGVGLRHPDTLIDRGPTDRSRTTWHCADVRRRPMARVER